MQHNFKLLVFAALLFTVFSTSSLPAQQETDSVVVGLREAAPFIVQEENGDWSGIAVELWEAVAEKNGLSYTYQTFLLADLLEALEAGRVDVAVAPLSITAEREKAFDFTLPFMQSGLAIATELKPSGWWQAAKRFVSLPFLQAAGALAFVISVFGLLIWLFERRKNEMFGGSTVEGLGNGFWWSAVTMTTVGYGDKAPVTLGGRIVGLVWMFAAIIIISGFTASIASSLTVGSLQTGIEGLDDLRGEKVGVLESSSAAAFLEDESIRYRSFPTLDGMMRALEEGRLAAVVHDAPILHFALMQNRNERDSLSVLPEILQPQAYAFGLETGSPHREQVNRALLEVIHSPEWESEVLEVYLGR